MAPIWAPGPAPGLARRRVVRIPRRNMCSTAPAIAGLWCRKGRRRFGTESTHCRTGSGGRTWSTRWAAVSTIRRALHDGHTPRLAQENATILSRRAKRRSRPGPDACTSGRGEHPGRWIEASGVNMFSRDWWFLGRGTLVRRRSPPLTLTSLERHPRRSPTTGAVRRCRRTRRQRNGRPGRSRKGSRASHQWFEVTTFSGQPGGYPFPLRRRVCNLG